MVLTTVSGASAIAWAVAVLSWAADCSATSSFPSGLDGTLKANASLTSERSPKNVGVTKSLVLLLKVKPVASGEASVFQFVSNAAAGPGKGKLGLSGEW